MYLKVMGEGSLPDSDPSKSCAIYADVRSAHYYYEPEDDTHNVKVTYKDGSTEVVCMFYEDHDGQLLFRPKAYLMNDEGKTIQTFTLPYELHRFTKTETA